MRKNGDSGQLWAKAAKSTASTHNPNPACPESIRDRREAVIHFQSQAAERLTQIEENLSQIGQRRFPLQFRP